MCEAEAQRHQTRLFPLHLSLLLHHHTPRERRVDGAREELDGLVAGRHHDSSRRSLAVLVDAELDGRGDGGDRRHVRAREAHGVVVQLVQLVGVERALLRRRGRGGRARVVVLLLLVVVVRGAAGGRVVLLLLLVVRRGLDRRGVAVVAAVLEGDAYCAWLLYLEGDVYCCVW